MKKIIKSFILSFLVLAIITSCKVDEENNDNKTIEELEQEGKIPSKLDRTDSLLGIDANNNGVRDDVERYIQEKFPNQIPEAMQLAKGHQDTLAMDEKDFDNPIKVRQTSLQVIRSVDCIFDKKRNRQIDGLYVIEAHVVAREIRAITMNTKARLTKFLKFNSKLSGTILPKPKKGDYCDE